MATVCAVCGVGLTFRTARFYSKQDLCPSCLKKIESEEANAARGPGTASTPEFLEVAVVDIRMPFGSMVVFMVKWAIASIPALIMLFLLGLLASAVFAGVFAGLGRGLR